MESELVNLEQSEISNIARKAFIRGKIDGISNLLDYFATFRSKFVKVEDLINHLRKEVGQDLYAGESGTTYTTKKPTWFSENLIETEFDAYGIVSAYWST